MPPVAMTTALARNEIEQAAAVGVRARQADAGDASAGPEPAVTMRSSAT